MAQRRDWTWQRQLETGKRFTDELVRAGEDKAGRKPAKHAAKKAPSEHKAGAKKPSGSS